MTLAGLVLALVGVGTAADTAREAATAAVFEGLVRGDEPGLAVLVRQDGKTVFERGYGVRDLRGRDSRQPQRPRPAGARAAGRGCYLGQAARR